MTAPPPLRTFRARLTENVRRYSGEARDALFDLRKTLHPDSPHLVDEKYLRWQFLQNPNASGEVPLWVYQKEGRVLGEQGGIPILLKVGGETVRASWAIGLAVRPEQKLRGIGPVLADSHRRDAGVALGLSVSEEARKVYLRGGWIDLGTLTLFTRPLDTSVLLSARWRKHRGRWLGRAIDLPLDSADALAALSVRWRGFELRPLTVFGAEDDAVWAEAAAAYPVIVRRRRGELNWRYIDYPGRRGHRYSCFRLWAPRGPSGWIVLREEPWRGAMLGQIVDYLAPPSALAPLFLAALGHFRERGAAGVVCLHRSPIAARLLPRLGFLRLASDCRLMVHPGDSSAAARNLLSDPSAWFVAAGDSDADHPRAPE